MYRLCSEIRLISPAKLVQDFVHHNMQLFNVWIFSSFQVVHLIFFHTESYRTAAMLNLYIFIHIRASHFMMYHIWFSKSCIMPKIWIEYLAICHTFTVYFILFVKEAALVNKLDSMLKNWHNLSLILGIYKDLNQLYLIFRSS